jgi:hypothetical protein
MNVPNQKTLQALFDQMQREHPIGGIAARYVDQALKKHPMASDKKSRKRKGSSKHNKK